MKLLANYLVHVHTTAAAECMVMGQKAGLSPDLIYQALKPGAGGSKMFEVRGAMMAKSDYREGGGTMFEIFEKDSAMNVNRKVVNDEARPPITLKDMKKLER